METEIPQTLFTKFGRATINERGYYTIVSRREGNHGRFLHRLIFEDFYRFEIPAGYVIHHKNGIKTDNCILNLQMLSKALHHSIHNKGKVTSEETKQRISKSKTGKKIKPFTKEHNNKISKGLSKTKNTTGYYRVHKQKDNTCRQGFRWCYCYIKNGKRKSIKSVDIEKLEQKIKDNGLEWIKFKD